MGLKKLLNNFLEKRKTTKRRKYQDSILESYPQTKACPRCTEFGNFEYLGIQLENRPSTARYRCLTCDEVMSLREIRRYNQIGSISSKR